MLTTILTSPLFQPVIEAVVGAALTWATAHAVATLSQHRKLAALAQVANVFGDCLQAAMKAAGGNLGKPTAAVAAVAWQAAYAHLMLSMPTIEKALGCELNVLLGSHAAIAAGEPVTAPGGATVTMPAPVKAGFFVLPWLALCLTLLAVPAMAQIENPPVADHWEAGILTPGLKFNLTGSAPASIGAGSGVDFNYLFGRYLYTTKTLDATTGKPLVLPWFGISLFAQGSINLVLSGTVSETESTSVGVGFILLDSLTLGWFAELVDAGPGVQTSGLFTNHLSLSDTGPELFYSVSLGAL